MDQKVLLVGLLVLPVDRAGHLGAEDDGPRKAQRRPKSEHGKQNAEHREEREREREREREQVTRLLYTELPRRVVFSETRPLVCARSLAGLRREECGIYACP